MAVDINCSFQKQEHHKHVLPVAAAGSRSCKQTTCGCHMCRRGPVALVSILHTPPVAVLVLPVPLAQEASVACAAELWLSTCGSARTPGAVRTDALLCCAACVELLSGGSAAVVTVLAVVAGASVSMVITPAQHTRTIVSAQQPVPHKHYYLAHTFACSTDRTSDVERTSWHIRLG
jgi:hypothetical protein